MPQSSRRNLFCPNQPVGGTILTAKRQKDRNLAFVPGWEKRTPSFGKKKNKKNKFGRRSPLTEVVPCAGFRCDLPQNSCGVDHGTRNEHIGNRNVQRENSQYLTPAPCHIKWYGHGWAWVMVGPSVWFRCSSPWFPEPAAFSPLLLDTST